MMSSPSRPDRCSRKLLFSFSNYVTPSGKVKYCTPFPLLHLATVARQLNVRVDGGLFYNFKSARRGLFLLMIPYNVWMQSERSKPAVATQTSTAMYDITCVLYPLSGQILHSQIPEGSCCLLQETVQWTLSYLAFCGGNRLNLPPKLTKITE